LESAYRPMSHSILEQNRPVQSLNNNLAMLAPPVTAPSVQQAAQAPMGKAFSGYQTPSGVSPWMNLYRTNTGGVDNYTTLVRPQFQQNYMNQQTGRDIRGLEQNTRTQGAGLQQLNRDTRNLQGVATPQFYQNYGNYYPGYGQ
jgi:hypothetical protein